MKTQGSPATLDQRLITALDTILRAAIDARASDVHLRANAPPAFRVDTLIQRSSLPAIAGDTLTEIARALLGAERWTAFESAQDADFACELPGLGRFRVNAHRQRGTMAMAIRIIRGQPPRLSTLFLPEICERLTHLGSGLVLVTGGSGSGKSTTLAGMIDSINRRDAGHIVTLEDPIEFIFESDRCVIEQREIGIDAPSFASGLRHVLRQDPDTILVGEMRDLETTAAAMTAAETGHRVLSTLHTSGAAETVQRIIDFYPAGQQGRIRTMLAGSLQGVISQTLLRRCDGAGLIPAVEVMVCTTAVRTCIREDRLIELHNLIETGRAAGMQTRDLAICEMLVRGYISKDEAMANCVNPERLGRWAA